MATIVINGKEYQAEAGESVLQVLIREGIEVPYLCYHEALSSYGACRLCMVEVTGGSRKGIVPSCTLTVSEGLVVETESAGVVRIRKVLLEMYLAEAPGSEKVRALAQKFGVETTRFSGFDISAKGDRCVLCGRCTRACTELLKVGAINFAGRGINTSINTPWYDVSSACVGCGACAYVCPADAVDIEDTPSDRIMVTWHNTQLKLKDCAEFKMPFTSERQVEYLRKTHPEVPEAPLEVSPEGRRMKSAAGFVLRARNKK